MLNESNIVVFQNLSIDVNAAILSTHLKTFGKINKISVIAPGKASYHLGVVVFESISIAQNAIQKYNETFFYDKKLNVYYCPLALVEKLKLTEFLITENDKYAKRKFSCDSTEIINNDLCKKVSRLDAVKQEEKCIMTEVETREVESQKDFRNFGEFVEAIRLIKSELSKLRENVKSLENDLGRVLGWFEEDSA